MSFLPGCRAGSVAWIVVRAQGIALMEKEPLLLLPIVLRSLMFLDFFRDVSRQLLVRKVRQLSFLMRTGKLVQLARFYEAIHG